MQSYQENYFKFQIPDRQLLYYIVLFINKHNWKQKYKAFIDRCTPWCNTHEPHATIGIGKNGYTIALRTGINEKECHRVAESIEHFYGHLEIEIKGRLYLCSITNKDDVEKISEKNCPYKRENPTFNIIATKLYSAALTYDRIARKLNADYKERNEIFFDIWNCYERALSL